MPSAQQAGPNHPFRFYKPSTQEDKKGCLPCAIEIAFEKSNFDLSVVRKSEVISRLLKEKLSPAKQNA